MTVNQLHRWDVSPAEAREIQLGLAARVVTLNEVGPVRFVAGTDISSVIRRSGPARGAVVVLTFPELELVEVKTAEMEVNFPYVPGLLSFREAPVVLAAWEKLKTDPDLLFVDGQGLAHPRRMGIACHLGLLLDKPTIGCAKSRLIGDCTPPEAKGGSYCHLTDHGEVVGAALRTRDGVKPVYVSIGHKIDLESAIAWTLRCSPRCRLPEPARLAHQAAGRWLAETEPH
ncbi:MAG: deoxyribonuclease V [Chloroflexi bacterium]|nr:deoxyribonuclease V [Chloroflexota bacterium]